MKEKWGTGRSILKTFIFISVVLSLLTLIPVTSYSQSAMVGSGRPHAVMRPDWETLAQWKEDYKNAPEAAIDTDVGMMLSAAKQEAVATSMSLLSYLDYTPADRDQGYCGNCWVWSGTGILEIADSVTYGADRKHRHSIQFFNSCNTDSYACKSGNLNMFSNWYRSQGYSIPWSNTKAYWQDYTQTCGMGTSSCVSCSSIATYPNYSVSVIQPETIATQGIGVGQDKAIANIKNVLQQNRAVEYGFCLATTADWSTFTSWWDNQPESSLLPNVDSYCGKTTDAGYACHAVLLVGYNDDDANAANHYWIMLNSWGTTAGRPNGLFRVPMVMNYDCTWQGGTPAVTENIRQFSTLNTGSGTSNTITVNKSGTGAVTSSDGRISCGSTCSATYTASTIVTLTATALSGGSFTGWGGDCTGTNSTCSLTMDRGRTVTATFSSSSSTTLTVAKMSTNNAGGTVTSAPSGINCGSTCKYGFSPGDTVTLTASPNASSGFTGWGRDGAACGSVDTCTLTVNDAMTVSAGFMSYTVNASSGKGTGTGTITSSPAGITCGNACKFGFPPGSPVTLNASPQPGSVFTGWSGACTGTDPSCAVTVSSNITLTATFDLTCTYSAVSPVTFNYNGGYKTVKLTGLNAGGGACPAPVIAPVDDWLSYDKLTFGNAKMNKNKGSVRIRALSYTDSYQARDGVVIVGPDTSVPFSLTVNQTAKPCSLGPLVPPNALYDSPAASNAFAVAPSPGDCSWTAEIDPSCKDCLWITISPATGDAVPYSIEENTTGKNRTGKIIVKLTDKPNVKRVFTIRQTR